MYDLIDQLERSLDTDLYYLSLFAALAIPDIAGALNSSDGTANGQRYRDWYNKWILPKKQERKYAFFPDNLKVKVPIPQSYFDGDTCYYFRCSILHQGTSQHPNSAYSRIIFIEPGTTKSTIHDSIINDTLCMDLIFFCEEIIGGVKNWLSHVKGTQPFENNYANSLKRYPNGLSSYITGVPVIG